METELSHSERLKTAEAEALKISECLSKLLIEESELDRKLLENPELAITFLGMHPKFESDGKIDLNIEGYLEGYGSSDADDIADIYFEGRQKECYPSR